MQLPTSDIAHVDMFFKLARIVSNSLPEMTTFLLSVLTLLPGHYLLQIVLFNSSKMGLSRSHHFICNTAAQICCFYLQVAGMVTCNVPNTSKILSHTY